MIEGTIKDREECSSKRVFKMADDTPEDRLVFAE
jgi:hypothetical protein